jgi:hypothetical protein
MIDASKFYEATTRIGVFKELSEANFVLTAASKSYNSTTILSITFSGV